MLASPNRRKYVTNAEFEEFLELVGFMNFNFTSIQ